ncbi:MAG: hypothetical protein A2Y76_02050 [Planctomycetes bacterium RBG_13_60_9]|nr:MAG: hypothetical protein A2Y76_02050 [Planctomycetes bacterium RBG_13_60_9]
MVSHLRRAFPPSVTSDTVKKLGLAPKNESYLVNTLRFLGLIDEEGNKTEAAGRIFSLHEDGAFQNEFAAIVKKAYSQLFDLHSDDAWKLDTNKLIAFFRQTDQSSAVVGRCQANAFRTLVGLAGHGETSEPRKKGDGETKAMPRKKGQQARPKPSQQAGVGATDGHQQQYNVGLTVRVEVNLPAEGNQETYDRIFKSIRENLLNG